MQSGPVRPSRPGPSSRLAVEQPAPALRAAVSSRLPQPRPLRRSPTAEQRGRRAGGGEQETPVPSALPNLTAAENPASELRVGELVKSVNDPPGCLTFLESNPELAFGKISKLAVSPREPQAQAQGPRRLTALEKHQDAWAKADHSFLG